MLSYPGTYRCLMVVPDRGSRKVDFVSQKITQKHSYFSGDCIVIGVGTNDCYFN